jgi:putative transposase
MSRQAFYKALNPSVEQAERTPHQEVLDLAREIRSSFLPGSSSREVYGYIRRDPRHDARLKGWGRDAFEHFCLKNGFRIEIRRFVPKTTQRGDYIFDNLVEGLCITDIDKVWVSDICYIYGGNSSLIGYATTLIDVYSRYLLGLAFSKTMHAAVTSQVVIKQALEIRKTDQFHHLIFHSDGGKQYIEKGFLDIIRSKNIRSSMAETCYENAFAESFNDILKNHILPDMTINSFTQLKKYEQFIKNCYNEHRRHGSLPKMTPSQFEQHLLNVQPCQRTKLCINTLKEEKP